MAWASQLLKLADYLQRKPGQLSGGQRQRVAIGRAIVRKSPLYLFDEPLSNLDAKLRAEMRLEIKRLHQALGATMIYVTDDQIEAMTMATRRQPPRPGPACRCGWAAACWPCRSTGWDRTDQANSAARPVHLGLRPGHLALGDGPLPVVLPDAVRAGPAGLSLSDPAGGRRR